MSTMASDPDFDDKEQAKGERETVDEALAPAASGIARSPGHVPGPAGHHESRACRGAAASRRTSHRAVKRGTRGIAVDRRCVTGHHSNAAPVAQLDRALASE